MHDQPLHTDIPDWHRQVAQRAHELWERDGEPEGRDLYYWLTAERLVRAEYQTSEIATLDEDQHPVHPHHGHHQETR